MLFDRERKDDADKSKSPSKVGRRILLRGSMGLGGAVTLGSAGLMSWQQTSSAPAPGSDVSALQAQVEHTGHGDSEQSAATPVPWESEDLIEQEERRSVDGVLETTLEVDYAHMVIGGYWLLSGATVRCIAGGQPDRLVVRFRSFDTTNR